MAQTDCTDITPPQILALDVIGNGTCDLPQPSATATDNEDLQVDITVSTQTTTVESCVLFQPAIGNNLCNYSAESAMILMNMPTAYRYYTLDSGSFSTYADGTAHFTAVFTSTTVPTGHFEADVWFHDGMDWAAWSAQPFHYYKADCEGVASEHTNWMYYLMSSNSTLTGTGAFAGSNINLIHMPANQQYGYQVGLGANNYSPEYGSGGWFLAEGQIMLNGNNLGTGSTTGDFMFRHECEQSVEVSYVYAATDNCGNSTLLEQEVDVCADMNLILLNMPLAGDVLTACEWMEWQPEFFSLCDGAVDATLSYSFGNSDVENQYAANVQLDCVNACGTQRSFSFDTFIVTGDDSPCDLFACLADFNGDHFVGASDMGTLMGNFNTNDPQTDLNDDGIVNIPDLLIVIENFGNMCD